MFEAIPGRVGCLQAEAVAADVASCRDARTCPTSDAAQLKAYFRPYLVTSATDALYLKVSISSATIRS